MRIDLITNAFSIFTLMLIGTTAIASRTYGDWPSWRGPNDTGSISTGSYPERLGESNLRWKVELPGKGCSTPIVLDQMICVTAPVDGKDAVLAYDAAGKQLWGTTFGAENAGRHRNGSGSNASPVTDGDSIFVYFKSGTLAAVDLDGTIRWQTNLVEKYGKDTLFWDHGTSPVLTRKYVVMARMHEGDSWLAAFDKSSGDLVWKVARNYQVPKECDHGYTTPLVIEHNGKESLLVWGGQHLTIHRSTDGALSWSCGNFNPDSNKLWPAVSTPVVVNDVAVICYGRNDRKIPRMFGVRLSGSGDATKTNHLWLRDDISTFVPSPATYKGHVYVVRDRGEVECIEPKTGENVWSEAFPKGRSNYYASPLIAGDKMYAPREDGVVFVASVADGKFNLLSENDMEEPIIGSPVPIASQILLRGEKHLFCFACP